MNALVQTGRLFSGTLGRERGLQQVQSLAKNIYLLCRLPILLLPSVTMMLAWSLYRDTAWSGISLEAAIVLAVSLWFAELLLVPLLAEVVRVTGVASPARAPRRRFALLEALAPLTLMIGPLFLAVPRLFVYGVAMTAVASGMLLFLGDFRISDPEHRPLQ
jgi:hypothetical protein